MLTLIKGGAGINSIPTLSTQPASAKAAHKEANKYFNLNNNKDIQMQYKLIMFNIEVMVIR